MATNNAINLKSSGIASYDGAGAFSALANPLTIANGGSGASSQTAYAVLCAGTTSTNPIQSIAGVGTANQVLTSNGAAALPTFQNLTRAKSMYVTWAQNTNFSPADSTTYYMSISGTVAVAAGSGTRIYVPNSITVSAIYGVVVVGGTLGSTENVTIAIRKNDTTDTNITTTSQWSAATVTFSNTGLSVGFSAGDYMNIRIITPAWVTNPTNVQMSVYVYGN